MRVTSSMLVKNFLNNLNTNLRRMEKYQNKLTTGREINVPSDDPVAASLSMRLRSELTTTEQYKANVNNSLSWLENTETSLINIGKALDRIRVITEYGANGTLSNDDREKLAAEVSELKNHLLQEANSTYTGRYIFAGYKTKAPAYIKGPDGTVTYQGDSGKIEYQVGEGAKLQVNYTGPQVFGQPYDLFQVVDSVYQDLVSGDTQVLSEQRLKELDEVIGNVLKCRAEIGAKVNRLEKTLSAYDDSTINLTKLLSETEDVDIAQIVMDLSMEENVYRVALASGARIIQPSLLDFLR
jgi:flagellar hook-associated protein 3 FlgL